MIYFQLELTCTSVLSPVRADSPSAHAKPENKQKFLETYNTDLLDFYEGHSLPVFLQFLSFQPDNEKNLLSCAAYDASSVESGKIDIRADLFQACELIEFPYEIQAVIFHEIRTLDYLRLMERYSMETIRVRNLFRDQFGATYARYKATGYQTQERIVQKNEIQNKTTMKKELKKLMPDAALVEEMDRIFSKKHPKDLCYGIPVHYKITTKSDLIADEIIDLILAGLSVNNRTLSRRVTKIEQIEAKHLDTQTLEDLFRCSENSALEIVLSGDIATEQEYASQFHWVADLLAEYVKKNCETTLFFFLENASHPGFAKQLLGKLESEINILEIREGAGDTRQAASYFKNLLKNSNMQKFYKNDTIFEKGCFYSASEVRSQFHQWKKAVLKNQVYCAYRQNPTLKISRKLSEKGSAFEELQKMVGLTEVKEIVQDILAAFKVQKLRNTYYNSSEVSTQHMIFTGNPVTAKTTVARLLTEILKENHILKTGAETSL